MKKIRNAVIVNIYNYAHSFFGDGFFFNALHWYIARLDDIQTALKIVNKIETYFYEHFRTS